MATAFTASHGHAAVRSLGSTTEPKVNRAKRSKVAVFVSDLIEDVRQKPLQAAAFAKHDIFREHINAMSISYFALIVLLILLSLPVLAYLIHY